MINKDKRKEKNILQADLDDYNYYYYYTLL